MSREALAFSITAEISDFGQRLRAPILTGGGTVRSATRRQNVGTLTCKKAALSFAVSNGSVRCIYQPFCRDSVRDGMMFTDPGWFSPINASR